MSESGHCTVDDKKRRYQPGFFAYIQRQTEDMILGTEMLICHRNKCRFGYGHTRPLFFFTDLRKSSL